MPAVHNRTSTIFLLNIDKRWAENGNFAFLQFNQLRRHRLTSSIHAESDRMSHAAESFHELMQAVFDSVFCARDCHGTSKTELPRDGGLFGRTRGFFGVVEAQGRGSLHAHMVLWGPSVARMISEAIASSGDTQLQEVKEYMYVESVVSTAAQPQATLGCRGDATVPEV